MPECTQAGDEVDFLIYLDNPGEVPLNSDSVTFHFTQAAIDDGFTDDMVTTDGDTLLIVHLPKEARDGVEYGLHLHIGSECESSTLDKDLTFSLKFAKTQLEQRYNNILGLVKDSFPNQTLSDFVWFLVIGVLLILLSLLFLRLGWLIWKKQRMDLSGLNVQNYFDYDIDKLNQQYGENN